MFKNREEAERKLEIWGGVNRIIANKARKYLSQNQDQAVNQPVEAPVKEAEPMTIDELYALNKEQQISVLKELGETKIPRFEKGRVEKIYSLQ